MFSEIDLKDLVNRAIDLNYPARPPLYFRTDPERSELVQVSYHAATNFVQSQGELDEWGCVWENVIGTGAGYVVSHPLADWSEYNQFHFPDPRLPSRFKELEQMRQRYPHKFIAVALGLSGFGIVSALRGFDQSLIDCVLNTDILATLMDGVIQHENAVIEEVAHRGADGIWFFDDWGTEKALFIRPSLWRELFKPLYQRQFEKAHAQGLRIFFHSCGYVWDIIPDLIEIGVDVLNLEQMLLFSKDGLSGYQRIADNFGKKVCFTVNIDTQRTLTGGSLQEIEAEARHIFDIFDRQEGGFIPFADAGKDHYIHPEQNLALVERLFTEYIFERA